MPRKPRTSSAAEIATVNGWSIHRARMGASITFAVSAQSTCGRYTVAAKHGFAYKRDAVAYARATPVPGDDTLTAEQRASQDKYRGLFAEKCTS